MCFHDVTLPGVSRADAIRGLAAVGGLPLIAGIAPRGVSAAPVNDGAETIALVGGTALLGDRLTVTYDATIVISGNRIVAAGPSNSVTIPQGAKRIAIRDTYVMPGLIDSHVHFFQSGGLFTRPDAIDLRSFRPYTDELASIDANLPDTFARYLRAGITSVSDVGGPFWNYDVRARAAGMPVAPRVAAAGPLVSSVDREILSPHGDPPIVRIDKPEVARELVDREAQRKTDFVKLWWIVSKDHPAEAFHPVAEATMRRSKELHLRVAVHALELETAQLAVNTGTDILVHSVFDRDVDDAFVSSLRSRGVILCPTLRVLGGYQTTFAQRPQLSPQDLRLANPDTVATLFMLTDLPGAETSEQRIARAKANPVESRAAAMRNLRRLHEAGVTIAAGTDAGNIGTLHASSLYAELLTMVDSGLNAHDVLVTATLNGAKHMAREHELGTIAVGKIADFLVLEANPIDDIKNITKVQLVFKDGLAYRPADLNHDTPEQTVQRSFNALNAHNAEAVADLYAEGGQLEDRGASVRGFGAIEKYYSDFFARNPNVHAKVTKRERRESDVVVASELSSLADGTAIRMESTFTVAGSSIASSTTRRLD